MTSVRNDLHVFMTWGLTSTSTRQELNQTISSTPSRIEGNDAVNLLLILLLAQAHELLIIMFRPFFFSLRVLLSKLISTKAFGETSMQINCICLFCTYSTRLELIFVCRPPSNKAAQHSATNAGSMEFSDHAVTHIRQAAGLQAKSVPLYKIAFAITVKSLCYFQGLVIGNGKSFSVWRRDHAKFSKTIQ